MSDYVIVHAPTHPNAWKNGYITEHRLIMAQALDRPLKSTEIVHHKDGNKWNNNLSNLEIVTRSSHAAHHMELLRPQRKRNQPKICARCRKSFVASHNNYGRNRFCSRACTNVFGEQALHAKLTDRDVVRIRAMAAQLSHRQLAKLFSISKTHIGRLLRGESRIF